MSQLPQSFRSSGNAEDHVRRYTRIGSVTFRKTNEPFGGLSNMAGGFPLEVNGIAILTSEALYQACRFPDLPDVQAMILRERSPMAAKMKSKPVRSQSRADWEAVRVPVMRWCLQVKLAQHYGRFGGLLRETGDRPIVEESRRDAFWGARPCGDEDLVGVNALGRLLMELRLRLSAEPVDAIQCVEPLGLPRFCLLGSAIRRVQPNAIAAIPEHPPGANGKTLFDTLP